MKELLRKKEKNMFVALYVLGYPLVTFGSEYRCLVTNTDTLKSQKTSIFLIDLN